MQYEISQEVGKVADGVIKRYHPDLAHKDIRYVMLSKIDSKTGQLCVKRSKSGHVVMAEVEMITGTKAFLISGESRTDENGPTGLFVIKVYKYTWNLLDENEREALIDEQLCQLNYNDETGAPSKGEYDAVMFASNVRRFGLWNERIERVLNAAKELPLFTDQAETEQAVSANGNGKDESRTFNVYMDRKCTQCGKMESTDSGLCLKCVGKRVEKNLKSDIAKKRGAAASTARS